MIVLPNASLLISPEIDLPTADIPSDIQVYFKLDVNGVAGTYALNPPNTTRLSPSSIRYVVPASGVNTVTYTAKYFYGNGTPVTDVDGNDLPTVSASIEVL
jgi:hypothetical protein